MAWNSALPGRTGIIWPLATIAVAAVYNNLMKRGRNHICKSKHVKEKKRYSMTENLPKGKVAEQNV